MKRALLAHRCAPPVRHDSGGLGEIHMLKRIFNNTVSNNIFRFCRSKCHKNFKMTRNPRKVKWTKAYRRLHGKDMTQDSTFEFERKRNRPERYDRNLGENTLKAIKKIEKVRVARAEAHHKNMMKGKKTIERRQDAKEMEQSIPAILTEQPKIKVKVPQQLEENRMEE